METPATESSSTPEVVTYGQQVSNIVATATKVDGIVQIPEMDKNISEALQYSVTSEIRRRNTESALSKTRTQLKTSEGITEQLKSKVVGSIKVNVSPEDQERLGELMHSDPVAWRKEMNALEVQATTAFQTEMGDITSQASQQAAQGSKEEVLNSFNELHPELQLTEEMIENDIPPRLSNKLKNGELTYNEFFEAAHKFLTQSKVVGSSSTASKSINMNNVGGGANPEDAALKKDMTSSYSNELY